MPAVTDLAHAPGPGARPVVATRVAVVDRDRRVRAEVRRLLAAAPDLAVCAEAGTLTELGELGHLHLPEVVVVDLGLGDVGSIDAARRLRSADPSMSLVVLTAAPDEEALFAAVMAGASAWVPKQLRGTDLVGTVQAVAEGLPVLSLGEREGVMAAARLCLPPVDLAVATRVAQAQTDGEIAAGLGLEEVAVRALVVRIARLLRPSSAHRDPERPGP